MLSGTQRRGTSRFLQTAGARISLHQMGTISCYYLPLLVTAHRLLTFCIETNSTNCVIIDGENSLEEPSFKAPVLDSAVRNGHAYEI